MARVAQVLVVLRLQRPDVALRGVEQYPDGLVPRLIDQAPFPAEDVIRPRSARDGHLGFDAQAARVLLPLIAFLDQPDPIGPLWEGRPVEVRPLGEIAHRVRTHGRGGCGVGLVKVIAAGEDHGAGGGSEGTGEPAAVPDRLARPDLAWSRGGPTASQGYGSLVRPGGEAAQRPVAEVAVDDAPERPRRDVLDLALLGVPSLHRGAQIPELANRILDPAADGLDLGLELAAGHRTAPWRGARARHVSIRALPRHWLYRLLYLCFPSEL